MVLNKYIYRYMAGAWQDMLYRRPYWHVLNGQTGLSKVVKNTMMFFPFKDRTRVCMTCSGWLFGSKWCQLFEQRQITRLFGALIADSKEEKAD